MVERWHLLWNDLVSQAAVTRFDTIDSPTISLSLLAACSSTLLVDYWQGALTKTVPTFPLLSFPYDSVRETAVILYSGAVADTTAQLWIPAPAFVQPPAFPGVFAADGYTVDAGNMAALTAVTFARLQNAGGAVCDAFNGGLLEHDLGSQSLLIPGDGMSHLVTTKWIDVYGSTTQTWWGQSDSGTDLRDTMQLYSNARWLEYWIATPIEPSFTAGAAGAFNTLDQARLEFVNDLGGRATIAIPSPVDELFSVDDRTVDPFDLLVENLIATIIDNVVDAQGNPVTRFIGGKRVHDSRGH